METRTDDVVRSAAVSAVMGAGDYWAKGGDMKQVIDAAVVALSDAGIRSTILSEDEVAEGDSAYLSEISYAADNILLAVDAALKTELPSEYK